MHYWILDATTPATGSPAILAWLPNILAALFLAAAAYFFLDNKKLQGGKKYYKTKANDFEIKLQEAAQKLSAITAQKEKLEKDLEDSELDRKALEDRLKLLEGKKVQPVKADAKPTAAVTPTITEKPIEKLPVQPPKPPANKVKFARYADTGDGFSAVELLDKPDGETIFELIIAPNNTMGEYKITNNPDAQRYALSNAQYFLGKTCQYDAFPSGTHAVIKTETPGTIKLTGNKWTIVNPAKISFS